MLNSKICEDLSKTSDDIFCEFILHISMNTNKSFLMIVLKIVILLRTFINKYKNIQMEMYKKYFPNKMLGNKEFTEYFDSENVPDLCNEFVSEYLWSFDYFGLNTDNNISEIIEIIQYFCYWLYENNYTTSKLTLFKS